MLKLPIVNKLSDAVRVVIDSNRNDGYTPSRFIQVTEDGEAQDLHAICEKLIVKGETLEYLEKALLKYPTLLLTLEDFIVRFGPTWGFSNEAVEAARARVVFFDRLAGGQRYQA